ncbi:MAG: DUF2071 domain-containing protein [Acidimicrobiales bacterium]
MAVRVDTPTTTTAPGARLRARGRLEHVALTTYAVEPSRLMPLLAPGVEPWTVTLDGGRTTALVSAVSFVAHSLAVTRLPLARFSGGHVDYRAAVRLTSQPETPAAWFLGAAMHSPLAWTLRGIWGMPWHWATVRVSDTAGTYQLAVHDHRFTAAATAASVPGPHVGLDGFDDVDGAASVLVNARLGLYRRGQRGRVWTYRVQHDPPTPVVARPVGARVTLFERLGLVDPGARLHSVLLVGGFGIAIDLPPRPLA